MQAPTWQDYSGAIESLLTLLLGAFVGFALTGLQSFLDRKRRRESLASALLIELRSLEHQLSLRYDDKEAASTRGTITTPVFDRFSNDLLLLRHDRLYPVLQFYAFVADIRLHLQSARERLDKGESLQFHDQQRVQQKAYFALETIAAAKSALEAAGGVLPDRLLTTVVSFVDFRRHRRSPLRITQRTIKRSRVHSNRLRLGQASDSNRHPMNWLGTNSTAIQAMAAIANVAVAVILAFLTAKYVRLTRSIAQASADQIGYMRDLATSTRKQQASALAALVTRLRVPIAALPPDSPDHSKLYHYAQLAEDDIRTLETLARGVDAQAITLASKAAVPLHNVIGFIRQARGIALNYGWTPTEAEKARWYEAHQSALGRLDDLASHCRAAAI